MKTLLALLLLTAPALAGTPTTKPAEPWPAIEQALGKGELKDDVYTIVKPRPDLQVGHLDMGIIPPAAGLQSILYFFKCPCGKTNVIGQLCVVDLELNAVIDDLRAGKIEVAGITPMFIGERPKVLVVRIQARATTEELTTGLKKVLATLEPKEQ